MYFWTRLDPSITQSKYSKYDGKYDLSLISMTSKKNDEIERDFKMLHLVINIVPDMRQQ